MKKIIALSIGIILMSFSAKANSLNYGGSFYNGYGDSYIFVVQNVEFSIYPDGQFDFTYINNRNGSNVNIVAQSPYVSISYNSGYNYDVYVQYDHYGAVIQVEDIPIYYDEFGRIAQAGDVEIFYRDRRISQIGGLYVHYNYYGNYSHCTGYINMFNYYYVYQPWHRYYMRPIYASCIVYDYPYRRYYYPERYTYYDHSVYYSNRGRSNVAYSNGRRSFYSPGSQIHYKNGRTAVNKDFRANRRNTAVTQNGRRDNSVSQSDRRDNSDTRRSTVNTNSVSNSDRSNTNSEIARTDTNNRKVTTNNKVNTRNNNNSNSTYNRSTSSANRNNSVSNKKSTVKKTNNKTSRNSTASTAKQKTSKENSNKKSSRSGSRRGI